MRKLGIIGIALLTGCSSAPKLDVNKMADKFYSQPRTYNVIKLTGVNEIQISGVDMTIEMQSQLQPLSVIPREKETLEQIVSVATSLGQMGLAGYGIYQGAEVMKQLSTSRDPLVVEKQVLVPVVGAQ